jgi:trigger factor
MANAELISRADNIARIKVALEASDVDTAFKAVYRQLSKELKVPGFRPGKVPPNIIRQRVGLSAIQGEVDDRLRQFAVNYALQELDLTPRGGQPRMEGDPTPAEGQALEYEFSIPILPDVTLPDYTQYTIELNKVALDDDLRGRYERRLIDRFTTTEEKEGAAESGDLLTIGIHSKYAEDDSDAAFGGHDIGFVIGREGNLPGWDEQLVGLSAGATKDFEYTMPEDFADARVAGKTLKLHVHVDKVERINPPTLDDEFLKANLGMETREQYDEYVNASLQREIDMQLLQNKKEAAMDRVVRELEAEISEDMLKDEIDGIVQENDRTLRRQGASLDQYLQEKGQSLSDYRDGLREAALNRIKFFLAAKAIADREGFEASRDDIGRYAYFLMQREGFTPEQLQELMKRREFYNEATYQIVLEKVLNHLADKVQFKVHGAEEATEEAREEG